MTFVDLENLLALLQRYQVCTYRTPELELSLVIPDAQVKNTDNAERDVVVPEHQKEKPSASELERAKLLVGIDPKYHGLFK